MQIVRQARDSFVPRTHAARICGVVYGIFYIGTWLKESMVACLPVEKVPHQLPAGKLRVVMSTLLGWDSVRADCFTHGDDLMDALRCSCAAFPLVLPHTFRGKVCLDGLFSEGASAPKLDDDESQVGDHLRQSRV